MINGRLVRFDRYGCSRRSSRRCRTTHRYSGESTQLWEWKSTDSNTPAKKSCHGLARRTILFHHKWSIRHSSVHRRTRRLRDGCRGAVTSTKFDNHLPQQFFEHLFEHGRIESQSMNQLQNLLKLSPRIRCQIFGLREECVEQRFVGDRHLRSCSANSIPLTLEQIGISSEREFEISSGATILIDIQYR